MAGWDLVDVWKDSQESPSLSKKLQNISSMELLLGEKITVVTKLKEFLLPGFYFCFKRQLVCAWRPPQASKPHRGSMERWDGARCSCPAPPRCCSWSISPSLCRSIFHSSERCEIWGFLHERKGGKGGAEEHVERGLRDRSGLLSLLAGVKCSISDAKKL